MHIPNGFLDPKMSAGLGFAAAGVLAYAMAKVRALVTSPALQKAYASVGNGIKSIGGDLKRTFSDFGQRLFIRMGLVGALVFAAQMFNFPVAQGTSGHLLGGVLAAVILGPFAGALVISAILIVQSLFFADGGILVLGANIFNMAVIGAIGGFYFYKILKRKIGFYPAAGIAAWFSVIAAAAMCSLEISLSGTFGLKETMIAMLGTHALIGLGEAAITVLALAFLLKIDASFIEGSHNE